MISYSYINNDLENGISSLIRFNHLYFNQHTYIDILKSYIETIQEPINLIDIPKILNVLFDKIEEIF